MKVKVIVGVDGGATTTKCVLADMEGHVLVRGVGGPSNQGFGKERKIQLRKALKECLKPALKSLEGQVDVESVCLGMTGLNVGERYNLIKNIAVEYLKTDKIKVLGDMEIAYQGATLGQPGILIYAGTGVNCYGKDVTEKTDHVNGWGYIVDDEGGGYDIGRRALQALFRAYDGREKPTLLTSKILNHFSCNSPEKLCQKIYSNRGIPRSRIGNLASLVSAAASEGDNVAKQILDRAGRELALCVIALNNKLNYSDRLRIYYCGGVFNAGHFILDSFTEEISKKISNFSIHTPAFNPDTGALLIAAQEINIKTESNFICNIRKTYDKFSASCY